MKNMRLNLIAAVCDNMGIGKNGDLPWRLKKELKYFSAQTKKVNNPEKKNVIIMGRKTYFGVPESKRPLPDRFNVILTSEPEKYEFPSEVIVAKSMEDAFLKLDEPKIKDQIENVWIVGGHSVYKEAMESPMCHRIYITRVMSTFDCDAFFPTIPDNFNRIKNDEDIPEEVQEENGIKYQYQIYEKV
ncbi:CLUMA_CG009982, isoform A [Clunio marinus]|uniref:dihydrofolate reductase n=1 Tax=Clunio marinus TaxID=568069 RepID=A0A1J1I9F6_9DIPT|nr:CLUMA_CG009982, isoform A [Clunio marinus]